MIWARVIWWTVAAAIVIAAPSWIEAVAVASLAWVMRPTDEDARQAPQERTTKTERET